MWRSAIVEDLKRRSMRRDDAVGVLETFFELAHGHPDGHSVYTGLFFMTFLFRFIEKHGTVCMDDKQCAGVVAGLRKYADAAGDMYDVRCGTFGGEVNQSKVG